MHDHDTAVKQGHRVTLYERVTREPHVPHEFYVVDCACGWQSPLCKTRDRARALYDAHREREGEQLSS